ncbi:MAG: hypothetical protein DHS20C18_53080 [Saprospiraceae bacterium]|nr:MAG: hypothetical protein DHS20C18_53080 [Saprospiraceae bacterium]
MKLSNEAHIPSILLVKKIFEGTSAYTGRQFFKHLVKQLAEVLGVHGVWITEYKEQEYRLNSLAFSLNGVFIEKYEYDIKGTPCEPVIESNGICHIPENVIELFPNDPDLAPLDAVSYMGIALRNTEGKILGHLAMLDNKPMKELPEVFGIFDYFAVRAAAELQRMHYENHLQASKAKISRLFNGTMDAIIEFNTDMLITQANEAALTTFKVKKIDFIGQPIKKFLEETAFQKLMDTRSLLKNEADEPASLWIQGYLQCLNSEKGVFPADATLSCYRFESQYFYALFIRDVKDRLQQEAEIKKLMVETRMLKEKVGIHQINNIIGESELLKMMLAQVELVAPTDSTVLILGETGTGKELVAREIFRKSKRGDQPFITLNCAVLPPDLIESELFGHVKGAFTGAIKAREGRFKLADGGTIFLDEVGELPSSLQAKLLRVIQEGEFEMVGSSITQKIDVRIIAATHRNLKKEVARQRFREDLYYRLNVFPIHIPPLRERGNDILLLTEAFLKKNSIRYGRPLLPLTDIDRTKLLKYSWPGNVRELQNIIERAVITSQQEKIHIALATNEDPRIETIAQPIKGVMTQKELTRLEIENLKIALKETKGKVFGEDGAAKLIGIPPTTLGSKLKKHGIDPKTFA